MTNSFNAKSSLSVNGKHYTYYSLPESAKSFPVFYRSFASDDDLREDIEASLETLELDFKYSQISFNIRLSKFGWSLVLRLFAMSVAVLSFFSRGNLSRHCEQPLWTRDALKTALD